MRWLAALAAGACAAIALFATFYGQRSLDDWRSERASLLARIAGLENNPAAENRDGNLAMARELLELTNGVATEKVGVSVLALVLAVIALTASWRYARRFFSRGKLMAVASLGALIPIAISGTVVVILGLGAIRG